jgi:hypothetical protein
LSLRKSCWRQRGKHHTKNCQKHDSPLHTFLPIKWGCNARQVGQA